MNQIENIVSQLTNLYTPGEVFPNCTFIYGQKSVGKSLCVRKFLETSREEIQSVIISADECYSNKILFEAIVNTFNNHELNEENNFEPFAKAESMEEFLNEISRLDDEKSYLIAIEKAERLRDMDINIIPSLMKLQELTGLNISSIFISHIALEKFNINDWDVVKIHVPDYTKNDILEIFLSNYETVQRNVIKKIEKSQMSEEEREKRIETAQVMDEEFYKHYLNIFLNVFYKACRDITELGFIAEKCYSSYYAPVLTGEIKHNDITNLWRNITKPLKLSLNTIYMRVGNLSVMEIKKEEENEDFMSEHIARPNSIKTFAQMLELPYYAKYLLIASFLASHNDAKSDKKLFLKHHGKERKRAQNSKVSEKLNVQFGPKSFTIDRLLAIFYAILDEKIGLTCNLLSQISTLVDLNFLTFTSGENNVMEGTARLQSTIGLDFAINIGKVVGFNVRQYLTDFH